MICVTRFVETQRQWKFQVRGMAKMIDGNSTYIVTGADI